MTTVELQWALRNCHSSELRMYARRAADELARVDHRVVAMSPWVADDPPPPIRTPMPTIIVDPCVHHLCDACLDREEMRIALVLWKFHRQYDEWFRGNWGDWPDQKRWIVRWWTKYGLPRGVVCTAIREYERFVDESHTIGGVGVWLADDVEWKPFGAIITEYMLRYYQMGRW